MVSSEEGSGVVFVVTSGIALVSVDDETKFFSDSKASFSATTDSYSSFDTVCEQAVTLSILSAIMIQSFFMLFFPFINAILTYTFPNTLPIT